MTQQERAELMQIIRELSYEEREVTLASGRKSNFYFDGKQTCLHARGGLLVGKAFWQEAKQFPGPIDGVGGLTLGADPIGPANGLTSCQQALPTNRPPRACRQVWLPSK
jgi:orotate phosphoribosyltransferase